MAFTCGCAPWDGIICPTHCQWLEGCTGERHTPECVRGERPENQRTQGTGRCDLPVGTLVQVTPFRVREGQDHPYRARVAGYDMGRTKYKLDREMWPGRFTDGGSWWAFPAEIEPITEED